MAAMIASDGVLRRCWVEVGGGEWFSQSEELVNLLWDRRLRLERASAQLGLVYQARFGFFGGGGFCGPVIHGPVTQAGLWLALIGCGGLHTKSES
jgi:hypothetical protein